MLISIPFIQKMYFTPELLSDDFIKVCQSNRSLRIDNNLEIRCKIAKLPSGSGFDQDLFKNKRSIQNMHGPYLLKINQKKVQIDLGNKFIKKIFTIF